MKNDLDIFAMVKRIEMPGINSRAQFIALLKFNHAIMRASEDLMTLAVLHSPPGELHDYYARHAPEEKDHAQWMAEDIAALGASVDPVDHAAAAIAGAQYYYLRHVGAHVFLGYLAALEGNPMPLESVVRLEHAFGAKGCRTLRYHAAHDIEHGLELQSVIREHGNDESVLLNALITARSIQQHLCDRMLGA